ncbi:RNA polymerase sigma factor [Sphingobacterium sp. Mn56C]|uniref:RNA polymerase sigma factor n=1 Tax=Sphingobacterium sp. Mn56C TaxID=3395261 RepID=UPI003BDF0F70
MNCTQNDLERHYFSLFKKGDARGFTYFFNGYWEQLYTIAYRHVRVEDQAKDIVQEVFIQVWEKRHLLHTDYQSLQPYLFKSVKNKVLNYYAREKVRKNVIETMFSRMDVIGMLEGDTLSHYRKLEQIVDRSVAKLPKLMQTVYLMRIDNQSVKDVARDLNIAEQTVKNYFSEAKRILKQDLTQRFSEQDNLPVVVIGSLILHHFLK